MKKRIIGIKGANLLQLGIQVSVGDVRTLLLLVGGFAASSDSNDLALGRTRPLLVGGFVLSGWLLRILYEISDEKRVGK